MQRTVPKTVSEAIELYIRTYYSLLRSSGDIRIRSLEETYAGMGSSLHLDADSTDFDAAAFHYAAMRLPKCIDSVRRIVFGQSDMVFKHGGFHDIESWQRVDSPARRRLLLYDGKETIAAYVSSVSDVDDLVPLLTAYQIEWNKLHRRLAMNALGKDLAAKTFKASAANEKLQQVLQLSPEEMIRLREAWVDHWDDRIYALASKEMDLRISSFAGGLTHYRRAMQSWWNELVQVASPLDLENRPIYFVSSNPHSLPNLISGFALTLKDELLDFVAAENPEGLVREMKTIFSGSNIETQSNFLYYVQREYLRHHRAKYKQFLKAQSEVGIVNFENSRALDVSAQVIDMCKIDPERLDPRLVHHGPDLSLLKKSRAVIVNVDYPLGFAAYHLLVQIASSTSRILGTYIMGKAASLNGRVGDVMIPNVVYDEHSRNTYLFKNIFQTHNISPYLIYGTVFDNQKAVTVRGTFLQNREFMSVFYNEGYTDLEMEAGPYLSAIYENIYPQRFPINEIVNLFINVPYDIGILHYASDTPYNRRKFLLSNSLSYYGVDATYACSIAILRRILHMETSRLHAMDRNGKL